MHYYEQGNVQLSTTHDISLALPPAISASGGASSANKVLALIDAEESKYQSSLNETYAEMGEKTFKGLRRALPMTRSKLDWDRVRAPSRHSASVMLRCGCVAGARIQAGCGVDEQQGRVRDAVFVGPHIPPFPLDAGRRKQNVQCCDIRIFASDLIALTHWKSGWQRAHEEQHPDCIDT